MGTYEPASTLDRYVAPGLRLWMLIALIFGILLVMVVIVCCFIRIRIPRTKRQIELIAARRKMRKQQQSNAAGGPNAGGVNGIEPHEDTQRGQTIVLNSIGQHRAGGGGGGERSSTDPRGHHHHHHHHKNIDQQPLVSKSIPV